ncbi:hypothetical protein GQ43DRAFT_374105, partial [Delitschia confertaspora ATCC 74209]
ESISRAIKGAADKAIPKRNPSPRSQPWWDEDTARKRRKLNQLERILHANPAISGTSQPYKAVRNCYFHCIREAKTKSWNDFMENAEDRGIFKDTGQSTGLPCQNP